MDKNYESLPDLDVRVYPLKEPQGNLLAMASVTIAGAFAVRGLRVMDGKNGLFVSMPQAKNGQGEWRDICYPISKEVREALNGAVIHGYHEQIREAKTAPAQNNAGRTIVPPMPQRGTAR